MYSRRLYPHNCLTSPGLAPLFPAARGPEPRRGVRGRPRHHCLGNVFALGGSGGEVPPPVRPCSRGEAHRAPLRGLNPGTRRHGHGYRAEAAPGGRSVDPLVKGAAGPAVRGDSQPADSLHRGPLSRDRLRPSAALCPTLPRRGGALRVGSGRGIPPLHVAAGATVSQQRLGLAAFTQPDGGTAGAAWPADASASPGGGGAGAAPRIPGGPYGTCDSPGLASGEWGQGWSGSHGDWWVPHGAGASTRCAQCSLFSRHRNMWREAACRRGPKGSCC